MPLPRSKARRKGFRSQLEQEVLRLQEVLREETALHAILDNALDHAAVTLADMSYLPTHVSAPPPPFSVWHPWPRPD